MLQSQQNDAMRVLLERVCKGTIFFDEFYKKSQDLSAESLETDFIGCRQTVKFEGNETLQDPFLKS